MKDESQVKILTRETLENCQMWYMPDVTTGQSRNINAATFNNEVEQIKQHAYEDGLKKGYDEAFGSKEAELNSKLTQLTEVLELLSQPMLVFNEQIENQLFQIVQIMVQQIVKTQLNLQPELLKSIFDAIIKELPIANEKIQLQMNPTDRESLQGFLSENELKKIDEFVPMESLHRGEIIMVTEHSSIDGSLRGRINAVLEKMSDDNSSQG